jgi:hypothetical protein
MEGALFQVYFLKLYLKDINQRSPILATACIIGVRSIIVQLGFFFYAA